MIMLDSRWIKSRLRNRTRRDVFIDDSDDERPDLHWTLSKLDRCGLLDKDVINIEELVEICDENSVSDYQKDE